MRSAVGGAGFSDKLLEPLIWWDVAHWISGKYQTSIPQTCQKYRVGNTFATKRIRLVMPSEIKTKQYMRRKFSNPRSPEKTCSTWTMSGLARNADVEHRTSEKRCLNAMDCSAGCVENPSPQHMRDRWTTSDHGRPSNDHIPPDLVVERVRRSLKAS